MMDKIALAVNAFNAHRDKKHVHFLRGCTTADAWSIASNLHGLTNGSVAILAGGDSMAGIGRDGDQQDDRHKIGWRGRNPIATTYYGFVETVLTERNVPFNTLIAVPRSISDLCKVKAYRVTGLDDARFTSN